MVEKQSSRFEAEVAAWKRIAAELKLRIEAPFRFAFENRTYECVALLPDFGSKRGMLIRSNVADASFMRDAEASGFGFSHVDVSHHANELRSAIEMLSDWGFNGSGEAPEWIIESFET